MNDLDAARPNTPDEMIAVIAAHKEGKQLQMRQLRLSRYQSESPWANASNPRFNFVRCQYRIAPPKPQERWGVTDNDGDFVTTYGSEQNAETAAKRYGGRHFLMREVVAG